MQLLTSLMNFLQGPAKPSSASSRGKKDDEDFTPLLPNNNAKNQRIIDDQKLKGMFFF